VANLIIESPGKAEIPLKKLGRKFKIVEIKSLGKNGETTHIGDFVLQDLLQKLETLDEGPVIIEEAILSSAYEPLHKKRRNP